MTTAVPRGLRRGTTDRVMSRLFPAADSFEPNEWADDHGIFLWSGQQKINDSVRDNRYTAVRSCHGIGKSFDAAVLVNAWLDSFPVGDAFVVTTAPTDRQVKAILWRYIRRIHANQSLRGRVTLDADYYLPIGGTEELVAYGRKPADYDPAAFQGIHQLNILVILDEACGVPKALYDAVDSLATNENARVLAIGNPDDPSSHFKKVCAPGSGWNSLRISVWDSPNFTGEKVPDRLRQELVSELWVEERLKRWGKDSPLYASKVDAEFPVISDDTLISSADLYRAQNEVNLPGMGPGRYGVDVARYGSDETVIYRNRDNVIRRVWQGHKASTMVTTGHVVRELRGAPNASFAVVDADGVGGGVVDRLLEQGYQVVPFHGGAAPSDPVKFFNLRAEMYWTLREMLEKDEIDLDPEDDELVSQLGSIKFKLTSRGQIQIESKEDMRKRGLPSPDRADGVMMTLKGANDLETFLQTARERRSDPVPDLTSDLYDRPL